MCNGVVITDLINIISNSMIASRTQKYISPYRIYKSIEPKQFQDS